MLETLRNRRYRHLFFAQIVALLGTGLMTVALGLLAYDLQGENAALVLGTIFTLKMVAYVGIAPIAGAYAGRVNRRALLVGLDLVRVMVALLLPLIAEPWQAYLLIFVLFCASAGFTPTFQATIPDVLPDEAQYSRALSLSRLAYDLENILSPTLAGLMLLFLSYDALFMGTGIGFAASALLVLSVSIPSPKPTPPRGIYERTTRGMRLYLATPRLRGLLAISLVVSSVGAMVLVNTVVLVRAELGLGESALAATMFAFGLGSMVAALVLPRILDRVSDRPVMLIGAVIAILSLLVLAAVVVLLGLSWAALLLSWFGVGFGYSVMLTPGGRLITRSSHAGDRPALFAAQFALSHACWLVTYPLSGWLLTQFGLLVALFGLACLAVLALGVALRVWPAGDPIEVEHSHDSLPPDHPHVQGQRRHSHPLIIDELHPKWATRF
ncbi:MAG: MFS transporter [Pelagimonas sp.]|jgi:MFS family permease|nr:MFS transporter [Pelagimonas sp.]